MAKRYSNIKWTKVGLRLTEEAVVIWEKWAKDPYASRGECPLCTEYFFKPENCEGCPIFQYTGVVTCGDTPFYAVEDDKPKTIQDEINLLKRLAANGRKALGVKS